MVSHLFKGVCLRGGYDIGWCSCFQAFYHEWSQKKKTAPDYTFHVVLFKLECLEIARIPSRFTVIVAEWHNNGNLLRENKQDNTVNSPESVGFH